MKVIENKGANIPSAPPLIPMGPPKKKVDNPKPEDAKTVTTSKSTTKAEPVKTDFMSQLKNIQAQKYKK